MEADLFALHGAHYYTPGIKDASLTSDTVHMHSRLLHKGINQKCDEPILAQLAVNVLAYRARVRIPARESAWPGFASENSTFCNHVDDSFASRKCNTVTTTAYSSLHKFVSKVVGA